MSDGLVFPHAYVLLPPLWPVVTRTLQFKVQPDAYAWLDQAAREVNQVWNWASATSKKAVKSFAGPARWLSGFDLNNLCAGVGECFERIGIDTVQCVNAEFATRRHQEKTSHLRFRHSGGSKKALGWVPFKAVNLKLKEKLREDLPKLRPRRKKETDEQWTLRQDKHQVEIARIEALPRKRSVQFMGKTLRLFQVERLFAARNSGAKLRAGNFAQNSLGEWFLNVTVSQDVLQPEALDGPDSSTGMDPGLKHATVTSDTGQSWDLGHAYRDREADIAQSQRRGHKKRAKRQHLAVKNARKDAQFKAIREIVDRSQHIFIGNANCALVNHGNLAKAGYDHAWGMLRTRLVSVGHRAGRIVLIVNEKDTTSTCSCCWALTGPTGRDMLIVRSWTCSCGVTHERDQNSGENIRQRGWIVLRSLTPPRHGAAVCGNESSG